MPIVTLDGGQSSAALGGQTIAYVSQLVAQHVPGAPDQLISSMMLLVMREFYTKSTAWRDIVGPYDVTTDPCVYLNPVDQNSLVQFVLGAYLFPFQGSDSPQPLTPLARMPVGGSPQQPSRFFMRQADEMLLYPTPDQDYGSVLFVYASLIPTTTAAVLPNYSYTQHTDALLYGCLSRLLIMKKRPWYDKDQAMYYERRFRQEILMARDIANRGMGPVDSPMQFPPFAGRSGSQLLPRASG